MIKIVKTRLLIKAILLALLIVACSSAAFSETPGYINRFVFTSKNKTTGPVFTWDSVYVAQDHVGIYRFSYNGKLEKFIKSDKKFAQIFANYRLGDFEPLGILSDKDTFKLPDGYKINVQAGSLVEFPFIINVIKEGKPATSELWRLDYKDDGKVGKPDANKLKILWKLPFNGRIPKNGAAVLDDWLYVLRDMRAGRYSIDKINVKTGCLEKQVYPGQMKTPSLKASRYPSYINGSSPPSGPSDYKEYIRVYLLNQQGKPSSQLPSLTVFDENLTGKHNFVLSSFDRLQYTYARLNNAGDRDPFFKEYLGGKFGYDPIPYDADRVMETARIYRKAIEQNNTNPFLDMYYILARLELGASPESLKEEIAGIDKKCNYDIFELSLIGALFVRYRFDDPGKHFLDEALKYAPAASPDYERSFASLVSSPAVHFAGVIRRMAGDKEPDYGRITRIVEYMTDMMPSNDYNYYIWSALSQKFNKMGKKDKAKYAAKKAGFYFGHNRYFAARDVAFFDMLSTLTVIFGALFLVLSVWFSFRAERRKNHFISEKYGVSELEGILELYRSRLKPAEKNLLGFLMSLGILSIMVDGLLLVLMQFTQETYRGVYNIILAVSILTGIVVGVYLVVVLMRVEREHYKKATVTGDRSWKNILNNSFLPFMGGQEKKALVALSLAGVLLASILLGLRTDSIFSITMPDYIIGGQYGSDQTHSLIKAQLKKDPRNPYTHLLMGYDYLLRGENEKAEEEYRMFLSRHPNDIGARANMALTRADRNPEEAISILGRLVQNRDLKKSYRYADRVYYDLTILEKMAVSKDSVSSYQKDLDAMKSGSVAANSIVRPGRLLPFAPTFEQEKRGLPPGVNIYRIAYSYLFPFVSVLSDKYYYSAIALHIAIAVYWIWTTILILSLYIIKEPPFVPGYCLRCGRMICDKCAIPHDNRQWCRECDNNESYHIPSIFHFLIPGLRQMQVGESIRGAIYMTLFLYGLSFCFILFFPLRENSFLHPGGNRYLGILQATTVPNTVFPYNVAADPTLRWFVFVVVLVALVPLALNVIEVLGRGRYKKRPPIPVFETQLLEVHAITTRLFQQTKLAEEKAAESSKDAAATRKAGKVNKIRKVVGATRPEQQKKEKNEKRITDGR